MSAPTPRAEPVRGTGRETPAAAAVDPWPLVVRVTGGRLDHRARPRLTRAGRPTGWLDLACGGSCLARVMDNALRKAECARCAERAGRDRDPERWRTAAAERRAQMAAGRGQHPLPFPV
ncbi:hypothetical protein ACFYNO_15280 [Kitasatospora sp. NPDC006697]|uniref:hypothetical protein n=1 Tax=unclassified Kitasatospora TaxID=2633591 RepID=UPI0036CC4DB8